VLSMDTNKKGFREVENAIERAFSEYGMVDICFANHDRELAPSTTNTGSNPIDTVLVTGTLKTNKCGYLPFDDLSNHRGTWADFPNAQVFGTEAAQELVNPAARRLQCKDPRVWKKYNAEFKKRANKHRLIERTFALEQEIDGPLTDAQMAKYEALDKLRSMIAKQAERKCRRLKMGKVCWTPEYKMALLKHRFWVLILKRHKGCKVGRKYLKRVAKQAGYSERINEPLLSALQEADEAWAAYKKVKKKATSLRGKFLDDLAAARAEIGQESASKGLIVLKTRERQRNRARLLKCLMNPSDRKGLASVKRPDQGRWDNGEWKGTWKEVNDKEGIEDCCLAENDRKLHQADHTDLMHPEIQKILGKTGCTEEATDFLYNGTWGDLPEYLNEASLAYLRETRIPYDIKRKGIFTFDHTT
jgi:hypothetical protein